MELGARPMKPEGDEDRESPRHSDSESDDSSELEELIALNMLRRRSLHVYFMYYCTMYIPYIAKNPLE